MPTELEFHRGSYGPFADGLKAMTSKLVNNGLLEEVPSGRMIVMRPGRSYDQGRRAFESGALLGWLDLELSPELEVEDAVFA